ncbi:LGFP repeat-containing protein [Nocardia albiluteola]|nr:esterase [Nocardia albiluteola]
MHHLARRTAATTMTLAAATLFFTACSSNNDGSSSSSSSSMTTAAAAAAQSSAAAGPTETKIQTPNGEFTITGHLMAKYNEMGGASSPLGAPTGNSVSGPNGGSCQEFTGGAICWSEPTGPHVVWGEIRKAWDSDGGVNGKLGYPTTDEKDVVGGKESDFSGGTISWVNEKTTVTPK